MINIENKEEVLKRAEELRRSPEFREPCPFCGASSREFRISNFLMEIDKQRFIQYFCTKCGYSMLLNYRVFIGESKVE